MKKYKVHIVWVIVAIVALAGGFFWGKSTVSTARFPGAGAFTGAASGTRAFAGRGGAAGAAGGGLVTGQILSASGDSMTVQLANGNSQVVFYSSSTAVTEPESVPATTLASGTSVMIMGTTNSDGSLTAQSIQVRPAGTSGFGSGAGAGAGAGTGGGAGASASS